MAATNGLATVLAPYRDGKGRLKTNLGDEGLRMLWALCDGSPTSASEFLGFGQNGRASLSKEFSRLGLPTEKRNCSGNGTFTGGMSTDDWRKLYLKETGRRERAHEVEWCLPRGHEYGILVGISDLHYGPHEMDLARWYRLRDWIAANPHVRWIGLGDYLDMATKTSPTGGQVLPYSVAKAMFAEDIEPIASQCFGLCHGNHEDRLARSEKVDENPVRQIAKDLGLHYFGKDGFIRVRLTKAQSKCAQVYDGRVHHGWGGARTEGGKQMKLRELFQSFSGDWAMMGHVHSLQMGEFLRAGIDGEGYVTQRGTPCAFTGSFLKWEAGSYAREAGMTPASLGAGTMHLYVTKHSCHARQ